MTEVDAPELGRPSPTRTQHAFRILVLLNECGETTNDLDPAGTVKVVRSELRLQAMDFWLRNPDYLADELVTMVENGLDPEYLRVADGLLKDPEPDLRWYPMPRWFFGAYESLDDAFSLLEAYGLATARRKGTPGRKRVRSDFYLTQAGADGVADLAKDPVLSWYVRQVKLVRLVAGDDLGGRLKERQYEQAAYAETELGVSIAPIADRVRLRLEERADSEDGSSGSTTAAAAEGDTE